MKRFPPASATLALAALACACSSPVTTRNGAAAATQQSLAPQTRRQQQQQSQRPSLCKGQRSPLPAPAGFVSDFAKVIDAQTKSRLETRLSELKESSGVEFAVVTVETTGGRDIFDYSIDVACGWGVGPGAGEPGGGLLLLVATKDRKWRVQVSRSLEAVLPDGAVKEIGDRMVEHFRRGDFGKGIASAVEEHVARLTPDAKAAAPAATP